MTDHVTVRMVPTRSQWSIRKLLWVGRAYRQIVILIRTAQENLLRAILGQVVIKSRLMTERIRVGAFRAVPAKLAVC